MCRKTFHKRWSAQPESSLPIHTISPGGKDGRVTRRRTPTLRISRAHSAELFRELSTPIPLSTNRRRVAELIAAAVHKSLLKGEIYDYPSAPDRNQCDRCKPPSRR